MTETAINTDQWLPNGGDADILLPPPPAKATALLDLRERRHPMTYQLRQMVLINAGTNVHVPSGRITAVDPRGGAAVLGDNGVGKTTTLRLLPLFFGHLPSQIVAVGQGQEPLVRFVLPTDFSAVAFEYQRGSARDEDIRLAVIRRRADDHDVPFYRLYRCGFRKELFVEEGRFLSDEETQMKATALGIATTSKLSTSEYRSVILRTPATSKEKERLRRYSVEWSFGPKQLDNLDRLVAAMVKKHINFADIVQVAVGLVQLDLGQGADRAKLNFKQGRGPIERWLKNREACADAFKLAPQVAALEESLRAHRAAEALFRARRADVAALSTARLSEKAEVAADLETMRAARQAELSAGALEHAQLTQAAAATSAAATAARRAYEDASGLAEHYENQLAAHWEMQVQDLPSIRLSKKALDGLVSSAEATHAEATARYQAMEQQARTETSERQLALEKEKQPHQARLTQALERAAAAETAALGEASALIEGRRRDLSAALEPLLEQRGTWASRKAVPAASDTALRAVELANDRLQAHTEDRNCAQQALAQSSAAELAARQAFAEHEQAIRAARQHMDAAAVAAESARLRLSPRPGTLLAALREHPHEGWRKTLGKVLNPELLEREDLCPVAVDDAAQTLYGWQLSTGVVAAPDWVDDRLAREALEAAETRAAAAETHWHTLQTALAPKGAALNAAEQATGLAQAKLGVLTGQTEKLKAALAVARLAVENERRHATAQADAELHRLNGEIEAIRAQQRTLQRELDSQSAAIKAAHRSQRDDASRLHDAAVAAIDGNIARIGVERQATLTRIATQLREHLGAAGVDVERLAELKQQALAAGEEVRTREEKEPLVARWQAWMAAGGPAKVEELKSNALRATAEAQLQTAQLSESAAKAAAAAKAHERDMEAMRKRLEDVDDDLAVLEALDQEFGDYLANGESVLDPAMTARELRGKVHADRGTLTRAADAVAKRAATIRQALTAKDTAVKELVDASLQRVAEGSEISRAAELCSTYKLIGPQIATDVNLTLKTLLANISAFQKAIQSFEREVATFNSRLQAGLNEVRCFERIKDLRLDIITNFENLGFYKKLSRMDDVVRRHANEFGKDYARELPPDETARALGDFVSVLSADGSVEVNLSSHITLNGSVTDNGQRKDFKRASELENISSEGLTSLVLITLMTALLNTIRGAEPVHVPWVTDEVGKFDPKNFLALMRMLQENRIDVVTASPELGPAQQAMFAQRYLFEDRGRIREYSPLVAAKPEVAQPAEARIEQ